MSAECNPAETVRRFSGGLQWAVVGSYGFNLYPTEDAARDRLTRTDKLYTVRLVDWKEQDG